MLKPNQFAEQIFDVLSFSIDQACHEQDWSIVSRDALAFGFTQSDVSTASAYAQKFELAIEPDIYLRLSYRSFNPSSPFRTFPATSKFECTLSHGNHVIKLHQNMFEEPVSAGEGAIWNELSFT